MNLLTNIHLLQEAYAVVHGIQFERRFSDRELELAIREIEEAEHDVEQMQTTEAKT